MTMPINYDVFESEFDSLNAIGARYGFDGEEEGDDDDDESEDFEVDLEAIGQYSFEIDLDEIGAYQHEDVKKGIHAVTRNPLTHAAIGATAAIVPWGTVAAGAMEIGVGAAEVYAEVGAPIGKAIEDGWNAIFGGGGGDKKKKEAARRAAIAKDKLRYEREVAANNEELLRRAKLAKKNARTLRQMADADAALRKGKKKKKKVSARILGLRAASKAIAKAMSKAHHRVPNAPKRIIKQHAKMLAKIIIKASKGNKKARKDLIAITTLASAPMAKAMAYTRALAKGARTKDARKIGKYAAKRNVKFMKKVLKLAKKYIKGKLGKVKLPELRLLRKASNKGAKNLIAAANRANKRRKGALSGLLVYARKVKRGKYVQSASSNATPGFVVLKKGKVISGRWKKK